MNLPSRLLLVISLVFMGLGIIVYRSNIAQQPLEVKLEREKPQDTPRQLVSDIIGQIRPEFSLPDLEGRVHTVSEWDGRVLAVNFWASWCLPCLDEIPELVSLQSRYGEEGLQIIGIALQKADELHEFVRQYNMKYPVLAGEAEVIAVAESYGNLIGALPYTAIVDRRGTVVFTRVGPVSRDEVEEIIKALL